MYLPDCKYMDADLARRWSQAADYPEVARAALREMYRQKGNVLHLGDDGLAQRGLFIRHLVMPGALTNTEQVLEFLATELSPKLHLSLMAQYFPNPAVAHDPLLGRCLSPEEYHEALATTERLGFTNIWTQDFSSPHFYNPDFSQAEPFSD
jgi:putative pyruvate formate lyase activating enzyme